MRFDYDGRAWDFDKDAITVDEYRDLKRKYKMTPLGFQQGLDEADPDAMTFLYWVMLRQNGDQRATLGDHLKPDVIALNNAIGAAVLAEAGAQAEAAADDEGEPDPTRPSPASPSPAPSPPSPVTPGAQPTGQGGAAASTGF